MHPMDEGSTVSEGRFEEVIHGWCILSYEHPASYNVEIKTLGGGVGKTYVKFCVEGSCNSTVAYIIVWGQ